MQKLPFQAHQQEKLCQSPFTVGSNWRMLTIPSQVTTQLCQLFEVCVQLHIYVVRPFLEAEVRGGSESS